MTKEIESQSVYEDDDVYAFLDINPQAPVHIIIAPKPKHLDVLTQFKNAEERHVTILGKLLLVAKKIAVQEKLDDGFRIVINDGENACKLMVLLFRSINKILLTLTLIRWKEVRVATWHEFLRHSLLSVLDKKIHLQHI